MTVHPSPGIHHSFHLFSQGRSPSETASHRSRNPRSDKKYRSTAGRVTSHKLVGGTGGGWSTKIYTIGFHRGHNGSQGTHRLNESNSCAQISPSVCVRHHTPVTAGPLKPPSLSKNDLGTEPEDSVVVNDRPLSPEPTLQSRCLSGDQGWDTVRMWWDPIHKVLPILFFKSYVTKNNQKEGTNCHSGILLHPGRDRTSTDIGGRPCSGPSSRTTSLLFDLRPPLYRRESIAQEKSRLGRSTFYCRPNLSLSLLGNCTSRIEFVGEL